MNRIDFNYVSDLMAVAFVKVFDLPKLKSDHLEVKLSDEPVEISYREFNHTGIVTIVKVAIENLNKTIEKLLDDIYPILSKYDTVKSNEVRSERDRIVNIEHDYEFKDEILTDELVDKMSQILAIHEKECSNFINSIARLINVLTRTDSPNRESTLDIIGTVTEMIVSIVLTNKNYPEIQDDKVVLKLRDNQMEFKFDDRGAVNTIVKSFISNRNKSLSNLYEEVTKLNLPSIDNLKSELDRIKSIEYDYGNDETPLAEYVDKLRESIEISKIQNNLYTELVSHVINQLR